MASIIMPVFNKSGYTDSCLQSIIRQTPKIHEHEFIIINNNSTDNTIEVIEKYRKSIPNLSIVTNESNIGVAASWNQGIKLATQDKICIINNDIQILTTNWVYNMKSQLDSNKNIYWVSPRTQYEINPDKMHLKICHYEQLQYGSLHDHYVVGCCFMLPRLALNDIGLFDEKFAIRYYEDLDYINRILSQRKKVSMCPRVTIYHAVGTTSRHVTGGDGNESYYNEKWGGSMFNILEKQRWFKDRGKAIKKFK